MLGAAQDLVRFFRAEGESKIHKVYRICKILKEE